MYAGKHLIIDLYQAKRLNDLELAKSTMLEIIEACGATLLHMHCHHFTPYEGITGIAVLSESHISLHSWPEQHYAAWDIFMCGQAKPELASDILERVFEPKTIASQIIKRGEHHV